MNHLRTLFSQADIEYAMVSYQFIRNRYVNKRVFLGIKYEV